MFTGIIQAVGKIAAIEKSQSDCKLTIEVASLDMATVNLGDSIAVNGVCLTAVEFNQQSFTADVSNETLSLTTLGHLAVGADVNLEKALSLSTPLGGHLVSGHVDGVGKIVSVGLTAVLSVLLSKLQQALQNTLLKKDRCVSMASA